MRRRIAAFAGALTVCSLPMPAWASGGAHVIDDADVETPGLCHLESLATRFGASGGLVNLAPACTARALPNVELGGAVIRTWSADTPTTTTIGPSVKLRLGAVPGGPGVALALAAAINVQTGVVDSGSAVIPLTFDLDERTRLNLNMGYLYAATGDRHRRIAGIQLDRAGCLGDGGAVRAGRGPCRSAGGGPLNAAGLD